MLSKLKLVIVKSFNLSQNFLSTLQYVNNQYFTIKIYSGNFYACNY